MRIVSVAQILTLAFVTISLLGVWGCSGAVGTTSGATGTASVMPGSITGSGALNLTVTYPVADVGSPVVSAFLIPCSGAALPLAFTLAPGSATFSASDIPAGCYTLSLVLLDASTVVMGEVQVVEVVPDATVSGAFSFRTATGSKIRVYLTPSLNDPLVVNLAGVPASIVVGGSVTVTPSVTNYARNVVYVFYLNGATVATGTNANSAWTFGSDLAVGTYRLDVAAYTADGLRAGSSGVVFTVQ